MLSHCAPPASSENLTSASLPPPTTFPDQTSMPPTQDSNGTLNDTTDDLRSDGELCEGLSDPSDLNGLCEVFTRCIQSQCPESPESAVALLCDQNVKTNVQRVKLCQENASIKTCDELFSAYDMPCPVAEITPPTMENTEATFNCANGQTVPLHMKCDYYIDCVDGSDESENLSCPYDFVCKQNNASIDPFQLCDGQADCPDHSDEDQLRCPSLFNCMDGTYLIYDAVCDFVEDCNNGVDEAMCR